MKVVAELVILKHFHKHLAFMQCFGSVQQKQQGLGSSSDPVLIKHLCLFGGCAPLGFYVYDQNFVPFLDETSSFVLYSL